MMRDTMKMRMGDSPRPISANSETMIQDTPEELV